MFVRGAVTIARQGCWHQKLQSKIADCRHQKLQFKIAEQACRDQKLQSKIAEQARCRDQELQSNLAEQGRHECKCDEHCTESVPLGTQG